MIAIKILSKIDFFITKQIEEIFKDKKFKKILETWSSINFLTKFIFEEKTEVKIFNIKFSEITDNINKYYDLNSIISHKMLDEFDSLGNNPLSIITSTYEIDLTKSNHIKAIENISDCCLYIYCPCIFFVTPKILGLNSMDNLYNISINTIYKNHNITDAYNFSQKKSSEFFGATISKIRIPSLLNYKKENYFLDYNFKKHKTITTGGNFAIIANIMYCFLSTGWFLNIFGIPSKTDIENADFLGLILNTNKKFCFEENFPNQKNIAKHNTEHFISDRQENLLSEIGIISLCQVKNKEEIFLYHLKSFCHFHKNKEEKNKNVGINQISIQHILCVGRFAHYIKAIGRKKIGDFSDNKEFETYLNEWIKNYVAANTEISDSVKRKYPLKSANIKVLLDFLLEKKYKCNINIQPHINYSSSSSDIELKTYIEF